MAYKNNIGYPIIHAIYMPGLFDKEIQLVNKRNKDIVISLNSTIQIPLVQVVVEKLPSHPSFYSSLNL